MNEPDPRMKALGARLDAIREKAGLSGRELADRAGWAPSKVSRIQNGTQRPSAEDIAKWAQETNAAEQADTLIAELADIPVRKTRFQENLANVQRDHGKLIAESRHIRYFDIAWIPGVVQTREYALRAMGQIWEINGRTDSLEEAVAARMRRQVHLHDPSKAFQLLIAEAALTEESIPTEVLVPQLHVLLTWLTAPNVQLGVLPRGRKRPWAPLAGFQMYDELAIVEDWFDEMTPPADKVARLFDDMWAVTAIGEGARPFIEKAIKEVQGGRS